MLPLLTVAGLTASITPITTLTSCGDDSKNISMSDGEFTKFGGNEKKAFGIGGKFLEGTNYSFTGNLSDWTSEFGKPTNFETETNFYFVVGQKASSRFNYTNLDKAIFEIDGSTVTFTTQESSKGNYIYHINKTTDQKWPTANSSIALKNVKLATTLEEGFVYFSNNYTED